MGKRIFSTVSLWLIIFATMYFFQARGGIVLAVLVGTLTQRELYQMVRRMGSAPFDRLGLLFGAAIMLSPLATARWALVTPEAILAVATVVFAIRIVGERNPENRVESLAWTLFGLIYVSLLLGYLVRIVTPMAGDTILPDGRLVLCLWVVAVSKFCDVGALLTGLAIGRHPMAPKTSPKKTWEGAVGGVAVSMGVGALVAWLGRAVVPAQLTPLRAALIAAPIAVIAIISDLVESVIKRRASIKDSGAGVPGIGGIFDLSDSLILTAPVAYFLLGLG